MKQLPSSRFDILTRLPKAGEIVYFNPKFIKKTNDILKLQHLRGIGIKILRVVDVQQKRKFVYYQQYTLNYKIPYEDFIQVSEEGKTRIRVPQSKQLTIYPFATLHCCPCGGVGTITLRLPEYQVVCITCGRKREDL